MELLEHKSVTHFVIVDKTGNLCWYISSTIGFSQFTNNGLNYYIGEQTAFSKVEDFKRKVILAIDSAETKGGTLSEKRNRFLEIFTENVNVVVAKASEAGVYFTVMVATFQRQEMVQHIQLGFTEYSFLKLKLNF